MRKLALIAVAVIVTAVLTTSGQWASGQSGTGPEPLPTPDTTSIPDYAATVVAEIRPVLDDSHATVTQRLKENRSISDEIQRVQGVMIEMVGVDRQIETENTERIISMLLSGEPDAAATAIADWQEALLAVTPVPGTGTGITTCNNCTVAQ